ARPAARADGPHRRRGGPAPCRPGDRAFGWGRHRGRASHPATPARRADPRRARRCHRDPGRRRGVPAAPLTNAGESDTLVSMTEPSETARRATEPEPPAEATEPDAASASEHVAVDPDAEAQTTGPS